MNKSLILIVLLIAAYLVYVDYKHRQNKAREVMLLGKKYVIDPMKAVLPVNPKPAYNTD